MLPDYGINDQGQIIPSNDSSRVVLIDSTKDARQDDHPFLGQSFLSSAYLLVNYDLETFTVSQSNVTKTKSLIAIAPQTCRNPAPTKPLDPGSLSTISSVLPSSPGRALPNRAIPGIVVGAIIFGLLLIGAMFLLRKRLVLQRVFGRTKESTMDHNGGTPDTGAHATDPFYLKPELPSDRQPPQEMPLVQHPLHCLAPFELPLERQSIQEMPLVQYPQCSLAPFDQPSDRQLPQDMSLNEHPPHDFAPFELPAPGKDRWRV